MAEIDALGLPEGVMEKFLRTNVQRIYKLDGGGA
jgi:predicted TIM-barrel fold metal-dependent hydrolase